VSEFEEFVKDLLTGAVAVAQARAEQEWAEQHIYGSESGRPLGILNVPINCRIEDVCMEEPK
jgi:hypothetical protein